MQISFMSLSRRTPGRCERSEDSLFSVGFQAKPEILRRGAKAPLTQNDMHEDFAIFTISCETTLEFMMKV
jgi:hypothetical protein